MSLSRIVRVTSSRSCLVKQACIGFDTLRTQQFSSSLFHFSEPDFEAARKWYAQHGEEPIKSEIGEVSYARSSGPGGQNVNKVNSKAQLRVSLDQLLPMLPEALHQAIRKSRYTAEKSNSLLIQCDESRKQTANKETCYRRLNELIEDAYHQTVPNETSPEQKRKVRKLQAADNEARLQMKKVHSSKKAARGKGSGIE